MGGGSYFIDYGKPINNLSDSQKKEGKRKWLARNEHKYDSKTYADLLNQIS